MKRKSKKEFIVNKKYFQDVNDLFLFTQHMKECDDGIERYQWRLYRNDYGCWHCFAEDAYWRKDQKESEKTALEILKKEWMEETWTEVKYEEVPLMIAGNVDITLAKEKIIDLIEINCPELTVKFI